MNIVPSLHPWDEFHLVMVDDLFNVLLDIVCQYFVENFSVYVHQRYWPQVFSLHVSLSGFGIRMMLVHKKSLGVFHQFGFFRTVCGE